MPILALSVSLASCYLPPHRDSLVAAKCTPVNALLLGTYDQSFSLNIPLYGGISEHYKHKVAELTGEQASRLSNLDDACRAWAYGALSSEKYGNILMAYYGGAVSQASNGVAPSDLLDKVIAAIKELQAHGSAPKDSDLAKGVTPEDEVRKIAAMPSATAASKMDAVYQEALPELSKFTETDDPDRKFQLFVLKKLTVIDAYLNNSPGPGQSGDGWRKQGPGTGNAPNPAEPIQSYTVFFTTNSAEITHGEKNGLLAVAAAWRTAGTKVEVLGFADPRGTSAHNRILSQRRAWEIELFLTQNGVSVVKASAGDPLLDMDTEFGEERVVLIKAIP
jgi:outer membrane protein OmpA-like peptidoglycan-associated protein